MALCPEMRVKWVTLLKLGLLHHSTISQVNVNIPLHLLNKSPHCLVFAQQRSSPSKTVRMPLYLFPPPFPSSSCWWWTHKILILVRVWPSYVGGLVTRHLPVDTTPRPGSGWVTVTLIRVGYIWSFFLYLSWGVFRFALCFSLDLFTVGGPVVALSSWLHSPQVQQRTHILLPWQGLDSTRQQQQ